MSHFARFLKHVAAGVCGAAITLSNAATPLLGATAAGSTVFVLSSFVAGEAEARPRRGKSAGHHRQRRSAAAPRRHHQVKRHDDYRDFVRRRHVLGFLYAASLPRGCTTVVVLDDGVRYYHCGSVYYRPYLDNGTTIYVIRN